ncbi:MAG: alpha/beta-hydrolase family protein [Balneolaceae bacterium]
MLIKQYFSTTGLLAGSLFFAFSLTPTLLPRTDPIQGIISGLSLAAGYSVGVFGVFLWSYFQLPKPNAKIQKWMQLSAGALFLLTTIIFLWSASGWQNDLREMMGMDLDGGVQPVIIGIVSILVFLTVLGVARLFRWTFRLLSRKLEKYVPRRVSSLTGLLAAFFLFWSVIDGVLFTSLLHLVDNSYQQFDALVEPEHAQPIDSIRTGSAASILAWDEMGRQGRRFLANGPAAEEISRFTDSITMDPIRVYVGMNAAESFEERADLALQELRRIEAFDRSLLILITPTGTGWVDPAAIEPLEYLHRGDITSVAAQYSYLPSPVALLAEDEYGADMARALFRAVYEYWTELPTDSRPRLYLHGLSLGALNSDRSFDLYDIIDDPFHGVLWSGPPFRTETWRSITERRNTGSPAWLPRFRDGSVVRFANQYGGLDEADAEWGAFRIAYLQYASDPVTFFDPQSFRFEPAWMSHPRGPDVSDHLRWFPIVTSVQLAADMLAGSAPTGFGHEYAAIHYLESWLPLTEPVGWSDDELDRLRNHFSSPEWY